MSLFLYTQNLYSCLLVIWLDIHGAFTYPPFSTFFLLNPSSTDSFNIGFNWASIEFNRINIDKISQMLFLLNQPEKKIVWIWAKEIFFWNNFSFVNKFEKLIKKISSVHNPSFSSFLSFFPYNRRIMKAFLYMREIFYVGKSSNKATRT